MFSFLQTSTQTRLTVGLVCLLTSVAILAVVLGIVPDRHGALREGRARLSEVVAMNTSTTISQRDVERLQAILQMLIERHGDILSAGVRTAAGELIVEVGEHDVYWQDLPAEQSIETHVQVPLFDNQGQWGGVELRFEPLASTGLAGWFGDPNVQLIIFLNCGSFLLFIFYLGKMLSHLDPHSAVPSHVRSALDTLAEGLLVIDRNERIVLANRAFAEAVNLSQEKLLGRKASTFAWRMEERPGAAASWPWRICLEQRTPQLETMMRMDLGERGVHTYKVNCSPVLGDGHRCRGVLIGLDDVTVLERQKQELARSKDEAESANQAKSTFLANMSHEIRTPMNAILGFTDVLRRGLSRTPQEQRQHLDTIHTSGEHLLSLINDILDLSKVEAGRLEVESIPCQPHAIAVDVLNVLSVRAREKGISLVFRVPEKIPATIHSDPLRLRQVLTNLAGNAIKFTKQGGVTIEAGVEISGTKSELVFHVIDTGAGIPAAAIDKIFEPFTQADNSVTRNFGGTGLGLTISRRFVEALGGSITVASEVGRGSVFTVRVPTGPLANVDWVNEADIRQWLSERHETPQQSQQVRKIRGGRILLVDDGEANRQLIQLVLSRAGLEVVEAENGQIAIDLAAQQKFDLIFMDMQMPVMDGYTATRRLRERGLTLPIVALTANAMIGDEEKCRAAGCTGFLAKPVNLDKLLQLLAEHLGEDTSAAAAIPKRAKPAPLAIPGKAAPSVMQSGVARTKANLPPLTSTLLNDDPDFHRIVVGFVDKLRKQLVEMRECFARGELMPLARHAHWLKGSAGTLGFAPFTEPAKELEKLAKAGQLDQIAAQLDVLDDLASSIEIPPLAVAVAT